MWKPKDKSGKVRKCQDVKAKCMYVCVFVRHSLKHMVHRVLPCMRTMRQEATNATVVVPMLLASHLSSLAFI